MNVHKIQSAIRKGLYDYIIELLGRNLTDYEHENIKSAVMVHDNLQAERLKEMADLNDVLMKKNKKLRDLNTNLFNQIKNLSTDSK